MFLYSIFSFLGYFLIMFVLMGLAILTGKYLISWLFYAVGGILQLLSLIGNAMTLYQTMEDFSASKSMYALFGLDTTSMDEALASDQIGLIIKWVFYAFIMIVTAIILRKRREQYLAQKSWQEYQERAAEKSRSAHGQSETNASAQKSQAPISVRQAEPTFSASAAANAPGWQCQCGRTNADYLMTCSCGITKQEMKLRKTKVE